MLGPCSDAAGVSVSAGILFLMVHIWSGRGLAGAAAEGRREGSVRRQDVAAAESQLQRDEEHRRRSAQKQSSRSNRT